MSAEDPKQKLRWGFSSIGAPEMNLADLAKLAARMECPNLELRTLNNTVELPSVLDAQYRTPEKARQPLEEEGVRMIALNSSFKLTEAGELARADLENFARWADNLHAPFIRVFGGGKWGEPVGIDKWQRAVDNLVWWRQSREKNGWKAELAVETHDAFSGSSQCLELFDRVGSELPVIWDTHHTWKLAGESPSGTWEQIGRHVCHVHLKDSISQASARLPYTYVPIGHGEFPWQEVTRLLSEHGFDGVISIEWEKLWHPELDPLETALREAREAGLW